MPKSSSPAVDTPELGYLSKRHPHVRADSDPHMAIQAPLPTVLTPTDDQKADIKDYPEEHERRLGSHVYPPSLADAGPSTLAYTHSITSASEPSSRRTSHAQRASIPYDTSHRGIRKWIYVLIRHLKFVGPGLVSSVAYFDPGNWTVDLQAGSQFGYKLLFVVLIAGLGGAFLQVLSLRLGIATSKSLPAQIRSLFLRMREHPKIRPWRWKRNCVMVGLYTLYAFAEVAIVATDLAELLGSAIAFNLLFPKLPLWGGVLLTAADVLVVLAFFQKPEQGRKGMMAFEILIVSLVLCVLACFIVLLVQIKPNWADAFYGYVPSKTIFGPDALYVSVGIIGATVMPHGLFLGSHLATIDRLDVAPRQPLERGHDDTLVSLFKQTSGVKQWWRSVVFGQHANNAATTTTTTTTTASPTPHASDMDAEGRSNWSRADDQATSDMASEKGHLEQRARYEDEMALFDRVRYVSVSIAHSTVDTVLSLISFAIVINSAILILAAAAFYYGSSEDVRQAGANADLFSAHDLIKRQIGKPAALIFALALLCAGQSSSVTATLAGIVVSEGFIEWKTSPIIRRIITRAISLVPSVAVSIAVGRQGVSDLLVASQVCLSVVLPFMVFPLVWITADREVMVVTNGPQRPIGEQAPERQGVSGVDELADTLDTTMPPTRVTSHLTRSSLPPHSRSFATHWVGTTLGYLIFLAVTAANGYVLLMLMMGKG